MLWLYDGGLIFFQIPRYDITAGLGLSVKRKIDITQCETQHVCHWENFIVMVF